MQVRWKIVETTRNGNASFGEICVAIRPRKKKKVKAKVVKKKAA